MISLSQKQRLIVLSLYVSILFISSWIAFGYWLPPLDHKGLWFYSGLSSLLLGSLLTSPYYTKPVDAVSYAVAAVVSMLSVNMATLGTGKDVDWVLWATITGYISLVLIAGIFSIGLRDSKFRKVSESLFVLCDTLGKPKVIFSTVFLFAIVAFHRDNVREFLTLGIIWVIIIAHRPLESVPHLYEKILRIWKQEQCRHVLGEVVAYQSPGILLVEQQSGSVPQFGSLVVIVNRDKTLSLTMVLDSFRLAERSWLRLLSLNKSISDKDAIVSYSGVCPSSTPIAIEAEESLCKCVSDSKEFTAKSNFIGIVAPDTNITKLQVEILNPNIDIEEGRLIEVRIGSKNVIYQIINGITKEEVIHQKNTHGYSKAEAKKIGTWNIEKTRFDVAKWIPRLNEPVYLIESKEAQINKQSIGHFPQTDYPVSVDTNTLVTHNAAILGILGAGKSYLAFELIERLINEKVKIICYDLTNQYASELSPYYFMDSESGKIGAINAIGVAGKSNFKQNIEEGGSINEFKKVIYDDLKEYLSDDNKTYLKIYNPSSFEVWKQVNRPFTGNPSMASLTPAEITRIITECVLEQLQGKITDKAHVCIVFEEAHSLIPEWSSVASDGDKLATNGTAKAILQGRKYGLGCIVITQRTANVTKSILNQCNTVFALRVFDSTGMEFLSNYIGNDYSSVLSTLEDRHAIIFGRASSCSEPVLLRLNDRDKFIKVFRTHDE